MVKIFKMRLEDIQPSQLYISFEKLCSVMKRFNPNDLGSIEPIPVKKLGEDVVFVDGHTRAFAAYLCGVLEVPVYWEDEELDWEAYEICVAWCKESGIRRISDLKTGWCLKRIMRHYGISVVKICSENWRKRGRRSSVKNRLCVLNQRIDLSSNKWHMYITRSESKNK